ncbi:hypothetical protein D3C76_951170 [compost metagenome]
MSAGVLSGSCAPSWPRSSARPRVPLSKRSQSGSSRGQCSARARSTRRGSIIGKPLVVPGKERRRLYCKGPVLADRVTKRGTLRRGARWGVMCFTLGMPELSEIPGMFSASPLGSAAELAP